MCTICFLWSEANLFKKPDLVVRLLINPTRIGIRKIWDFILASQCSYLHELNATILVDSRFTDTRTNVLFRYILPLFPKSRTIFLLVDLLGILPHFSKIDNSEF